LNRPVIVVHGGAGRIPEHRWDGATRGVAAAALCGWEVIKAGGRAVDAVTAAVGAMEADPQFNAGYGAVLNAAGAIRLDAAIQCGRHLDMGAVGDLPALRHPSALVRRMLDEKPSFLVGEAAMRQAEAWGFCAASNADLITTNRAAQWRAVERDGVAEQRPVFGDDGDTVGAVALDGHGDLAAMTSTGGVVFKPLGRVGDSPIIGSGLAADNELGAASATGIGEQLLKTVLCQVALEGLGCGMAPAAVARSALQRMQRRADSLGGMIVINPAGEVGIRHSSDHMSWAQMSADLARPLSGHQLR
jgi:beta-aspartyl-peptidase (threonine type)